MTQSLDNIRTSYDTVATSYADGGLPMDLYVHRWRAEGLTEIAVATGFTPYLDSAIPHDRLLFRK